MAFSQILRAILVALVVLISLNFPAQAEGPVARAVYFYSEYCVDCQEISRDVIDPLQRKYGDQLEIKALDIADPVSYELLLQLEERLRPERREIPTLFLGESVLVGDSIRDDLEGAIVDCLKAGGCDYPALDTVDRTPVTPISAEEIHLAYFHVKGCADCDRVVRDLDHLKARFPGMVITTVDLATPEGKLLNEAMGIHLGVDESRRLLAPAVFVGSDYLVADQIEATSLAKLLERHAVTGATPFWEDLRLPQEEAERSIVQRFFSFGVAPVLVAGLIDGLNPCAFATMIFFVSYLTIAQRKGREILFVGGAFTTGIFLAYYAIGMGFLTAVRSLAFLTVVAQIVYLATAAFCFVLAVFSLRDFVRIRRGGLADMSLQLPGFLKERVHRTIRERARVRRFVLAAFVSGVIISLLEFLCTGQIYLPTIVFVAGVAEFRGQAAFYLLLYNLMFIVPLVVVFVLAYFGTSSRDLTRFLQTRAALIKLLMAFVFVALGGWLVQAAL